MQQTAGIHILGIPSDSFDNAAAEIQRFFAELEDKPLYFDEWCKGLYLYKERGEIRILSDVHADYYDYDILLCDLVEHLAANVPSAPMHGTYDLANDYEGPEFHDFEITAAGKVIWGKTQPETEDADDGKFMAAAGRVYGESSEKALYGGVFGVLSPSDIKKACDIFALACSEGAPPEAVYEEMGIDGDSLSLNDLVTLLTENRDFISANFDCTSLCSYLSFLVDTFASVGIDIKFPEELQKALNESL